MATPDHERPGPRNPGAHEDGLRPHRRTLSKAPSSLQTAASTFYLLTAGPHPITVDGRIVGHGLPRRPIPLGELRSILLHPATGRACRDAAWRHLIDQTRTQRPAWTIAAAGVALPALRKMATELAEGYRGDAADIDSAVLTGFLEGLRRIEVDRPGVITRLRWCAYRAGITARYTRDGPMPMPQPVAESQPPPAPWGHPDLILFDAVAKGVLSPLQAELIGRSRLEDLTLKDAAAELGLGYEAACKARQRGETRLVAAMKNGDVEHRLSAHRPNSGLSRASGGNLEPGRVRGRSTISDGTPDTDGSAKDPNEEGAFCTGSVPRPTPTTGPRDAAPAQGGRRRDRSGRRRRYRGPRACTRRPGDGRARRPDGEAS